MYARPPKAYFHKIPMLVQGVENHTLASFIKFLENKDLVKFDIVGSSDECFENRLKLQKYVYIAQRWGLELPYKHSMYLYGPYSRTLTDDYYEIAEKPDLYATASLDLPPEFDREGFLGSIKNDLQWLEVAATLIDHNTELCRHDELVDNVESTKIGVEWEYVEGVLGDLDKHGLVRVHR